MLGGASHELLARVEVAGHGTRRLKSESWQQLLVPMPAAAEQRRIVARVREALVRVEEIVTLRKHALGESRAMPAAAIQDEWNAVTVCNATQKPLKELGKVTTGSTPSTSQIKFYGGSIPWITPGDITARRVISGARKYLTAVAVRDGGARVVTAGSVAVVCIGATIGKVGQCLTDTGINQQINAVTFGKQVDPAFGYWACRQLYSSIVTNAKQATLPILNKSSFESLSIPVPPLPIQRAIAERLNRIHDGGLSMVDEQEDGLIACAALKQSILRKAFAGEL
jgi:type I restriction enzyme S subunit